jgi:hypothetical protein
VRFLLVGSVLLYLLVCHQFCRYNSSYSTVFWCIRSTKDLGKVSHLQRGFICYPRNHWMRGSLYSHNDA